MNWYLKVLKQYADFGGRARRQEFWMFVLFNIIVSFILGLVDGILGFDSYGLGLLSGLYLLAILVPGLAVSVRRLHDIGKSGWMILVGLIPLIGIIWLLILYVQEGNSGENKYGQDPKGVLA